MGITLYLPFKGHLGSVWQDFIACIERFVTEYDMMRGGTVDVYIVDWEVEMEVRSSVCCCCDWGYQKKKGKRKTADRWTAEAVVTIILHKRYLLKLWLPFTTEWLSAEQCTVVRFLMVTTIMSVPRGRWIVLNI